MNPLRSRSIGSATEPYLQASGNKKQAKGRCSMSPSSVLIKTATLGKIRQALAKKTSSSLDSSLRSRSNGLAANPERRGRRVNRWSNQTTFHFEPANVFTLSVLDEGILLPSCAEMTLEEALMEGRPGLHGQFSPKSLRKRRCLKDERNS